MRQLVSVLGLAIFAMSQAQAELIINGQSVTTTANPIMSNSQSSYSSQNCLANLRSQAINSGVLARTYDRQTQKLTPVNSVSG